jgi:hypothetical protein
LPSDEISFDDIADAVEAVKRLQDQVSDLLITISRLDKRVEALETERSHG